MKNKGITLIALIITILIMLLLVGTTVKIITDGKLIEVTQNAVNETNNKDSDEQSTVNELIGILDKEDEETNSAPKITQYTAVATSSSFTVNMKAIDNDGDVLTYTLYYSTSQNGTYSKVGTSVRTAGISTTIEKTGLSNETTYWWYITVTDGEETVKSGNQSITTDEAFVVCTASYDVECSLITFSDDCTEHSVISGDDIIWVCRGNEENPLGNVYSETATTMYNCPNGCPYSTEKRAYSCSVCKNEEVYSAAWCFNCGYVGYAGFFKTGIERPAYGPVAHQAYGSLEDCPYCEGKCSEHELTTNHSTWCDIHQVAGTHVTCKGTHTYSAQGVCTACGAIK